MIARAPVLVVLLAVVGCSGEPPGAGTPHGAGLTGRSHVGGAVVATVDGVPITLDDVRRVASETGLPPREALERLVSEALLASEAQRRGLASAPRVRRATRQALAQATLAREIEARVTPESITDEELAAAYERAIRRFEVPARRGSVHVLARMPRTAPPDLDGLGRHFAEQAIADFATDSDPEAWLTRHSGITGRRFEVRAERVPPLGSGDAADPEYIAALATVASTGVVPVPIRSSFGWHAIVVTELVPARTVPRDEALATLRREIVTRRRAARLEQFLDELAASTPVVRDEAAIRAAFAADLQAMSTEAAPGP